MTFTGRGLYATSSKVPRGRRSGWLLIGAVVALVVLLGGTLAAFGSVQLGGDTRSDQFDGAEAVEVHSGSSGDISVYRAEGDSVVVERTLRGTPLADPRERVAMDGDTVTAESECGGAWFFGDCAVDYAIGVPDGTAVTIETASGDVELSEISGAVEVEAASGSIEGQDLRGDVRAATTTGEITLNGVEGDLDLESNTGSISAEGSGGRVTAETTTGEIDFEEFAADRFDIETTTGSVGLEAAFSTAEIETTTGEVGVQALETFRKLDVETTTGEVDLEVPPGSYRLSGESATGERHVAVDTSAGAGPRIAVTTTTGSVEVEAED
ncbi:DUF4097 family beta strand repeat protein [Streptomonospora sp. PA3]|uniref:DUF4097 family beta strand repeat-containing protein n=1 Tax=Streptomonospora sp. PA3 TaxID=2607326 RepID=UPI0012DD526C|nr:DUF4097 family beta strand repeat-containing protein [Streptomonospora sp. PA3]MUL42372.1 DUF4097 family beta strand repeat protein [Streptomonospora sp. PA3]